MTLARRWKTEPLFDRAPVHVTHSGDVYVRPEDLVRSRKFRETVEKLEAMLRKHPLPWVLPP